MYISRKNLELVKVVEKNKDKEEIFKIKNTKEDLFALVLEEIVSINPEEDTLNCCIFKTIEEAESKALYFLKIRENDPLIFRPQANK